jgi:predicted nucleic acid-binding protein
MAFILDASVAVAWVVARQATAYSRGIRLRAKREPYHAPALWRLEVVNVIGTLVHRGLLSGEAGRTAIDILGRLQPVIHESKQALTELFDLAQRHNLSAYDASYLALALDLKLPIACIDGKLRSALKLAGARLA